MGEDYYTESGSKVLRAVVLMPLVMTRLTEPSNLKRLAVVVVVGLHPIAAISEGACFTASLTRLRDQHAASDGLFCQVVCPFAGPLSAPKEVVVRPVPLLRSHLDPTAQQVPHCLSAYSEVCGDVAEAHARLIHDDALCGLFRREFFELSSHARIIPCPDTPVKKWGAAC